MNKQIEVIQNLIDALIQVHDESYEFSENIYRQAIAEARRVESLELELENQ